MNLYKYLMFQLFSSPLFRMLCTQMCDWFLLYLVQHQSMWQNILHFQISVRKNIDLRLSIFLKQVKNIHHNLFLSKYIQQVIVTDDRSSVDVGITIIDLENVTDSHHYCLYLFFNEFIVTHASGSIPRDFLYSLLF